MQERGAADQLPPFRESGYQIHSKVRAVAVALTILLLCFDFIAAKKISEQPHSGIRRKDLSIARVSRGSPAEMAGLRKGDRIVSIDGIPCATFKDASDCMAGQRPGETVTYGIVRNGQEIIVPVVLANTPLSEIVRKLSVLVVGISFVAIGLLVYFKRSDRVALVFCLFCLAFGFFLTGIATAGPGPPAGLHRYAFSDLLELLPPVLFLHFFLLFPERRGILDRYPRLEYLIYAPAILLFAISVYFNIVVYSLGRGYGDALGVFRSVTALHFFAFVILGLAAFFYAYRHVRAESMRRKLHLVVWGTIVGIVPIVSITIILSIRPELEIPGETLAFLPLVLVPIAFGHAIVRYGLLDLEIVFKKSLVYTLLVAALASIYFVVVYGIGRLASRFIGSPQLPFSIVSIFVITLLISPLRSRLKLAVDRLFFRQEYNYRTVLKQVSHSLAGIISLESLVSYLGIRVGEVLRARTAVVFLLDEKVGRHTPRYGFRVNHTMLSGFDDDGALCAHLKRVKTTLNVERELASNRPVPITQAEAETLLSIESALVVPFVFKSALLGFISIGRKESDEFFSSTDIELLETLCDQVSLAIENAKLYLETVEKQKMEKELEVAREIQHRLLPKVFPDIPCLRTHAVNIPSKHVGGDYFDLIPMDGEKVAVVIADVSGKGVPAALLMASLQSSLRGEVAAERPPSDIISTLNKVIFDHTSGGTFVTIFYGVINLARGTISYCNAGHPPPLVIEESGKMTRLDQTDIVIGIDDGPVYRDTTADIHPGDLLFLYTDGITDELDENDAPYGEKRLEETLLQVHRGALEDIVTTVHDGVLRHTGGKAQDDLTVLALRILELPARKSAALGPRDGALNSGDGALSSRDAALRPGDSAAETG
jgi:sigma-B regulation protein RsbU (phosphoserine phosphatase)